MTNLIHKKQADFHLIKSINYSDNSISINLFIASKMYPYPKIGITKFQSILKTFWANHNKDREWRERVRWRCWILIGGLVYTWLLDWNYIWLLTQFLISPQVCLLSPKQTQIRNLEEDLQLIRNTIHAKSQNQKSHLPHQRSWTRC